MVVLVCGHADLSCGETETRACVRFRVRLTLDGKSLEFQDLMVDEHNSSVGEIWGFWRIFEGSGQEMDLGNSMQRIWSIELKYQT